ncbi:YdcF family protein [Spirulina subsalsa FACHB-351]|uniref:YdcF family protein n=1 Tax=Spirulina subsalsa FACHB-351 TaxID=234711 RepID=A0ABT3L0D1_9CYAN|nr:YdcF family protein [Spirulina subsalsa]MCW6034961.1 YdcF family protein [Spirulina subsalsa FACHB-351]
MFELLTSTLLLLLIGVFLYYLLAKVIPKAALTVIGVGFILAVIAIAFISPTYTPVAVLWKVMSIPLTPLGLSLLLILSSVFKINKKGEIKQPAPALLWTALIILILSSNPLISYQIARAIELETIQVEQQKREACVQDCPEPLTPEPFQVGPAIVLLGQGSTEPNLGYRTQIQLTATGSRILYTAQLFRQQRELGSFPIVIVCASPRRNIQGSAEQIDEARDISIVLERLGVPESAIYPETVGLNLRTNALEVQRILSTQLGEDTPTILLVTSALQIRRAAQTFREVGMRVIPRPTDFQTFEGEEGARRRITLADLIPSIQALEITTNVIEEYLATIYYFLRGWLSPIVF